MATIVIVSQKGDLYNFNQMAGIKMDEWKEAYALLAVYEHWETGYLLYQGPQALCLKLLDDIHTHLAMNGDRRDPIVIDLRRSAEAFTRREV